MSQHPQNLPPKEWAEDTDWLRLGAVVKGIKARVEQAIRDRDEDSGAAAHDDLIRAEWRLRQAKRGRK
jgi:hypothetical protein